MARHLLAAMMLLLLAACGSYGPQPTDPQDVLALEAEIAALDPSIDRAEAARVARIAYSYTAQLAREYEITDPPLIHNTKVNMGLKPRGLCWHWAEDMENRLLAENFQTIDVLRAIANTESDWRIDHSTALVAPKGGTLANAVVLDPWRYGGRLFWDTATDDTRYDWVPQEVVHARWREEIRLGLREAPPQGATMN